MNTLRTNNIFINFFNDVTILYRYLFMDSEHYIEYNNGLTILRIKMTDYMNFTVKNLNFPDFPETSFNDQMTLPYIEGIIETLKEKPDSHGLCKSEWEYIKIIVDSSMVLNKSKERK